MSASLRPAAIPLIMALVREPDLNAWSALIRYPACWPARFGQAGLTLAPVAPWQAAHVAARAFPAAASPCGGCGRAAKLILGEWGSWQAVHCSVPACAASAT